MQGKIAEASCLGLGNGVPKWTRTQETSVNSSIDISITFCYPFSMKTAISIPDDIFRELEKFAKEHNYSRSEVFVLAVKELLKKMESKQLLDALNTAYSDVEPSEEKTLRRKSKKYYARAVLKEKY
jgi:predicted CopG family antitoxin